VSSPDRLVIRAWRPIEQIGFALLWASLAVLALTHARRTDVQSWAILIVLAVALWRLSRSSVVVSSNGLLYRGFLWDRDLAWQDIAHFGYGSNGVNVHTRSGRTLWLVPTKPVRFRRTEAVAQAESALRSIVQYEPEKDGFVLQSRAE
jgi:hypothetical protein